MGRGLRSSSIVAREARGYSSQRRVRKRWDKRLLWFVRYVIRSILMATAFSEEVRCSCGVWRDVMVDGWPLLRIFPELRWQSSSLAPVLSMVKTWPP